MKRTFVWALAATAFLFVRATALPSEAYVWQRQWTPDLVTALRQSAPMFSGWRVLAAETDTPRHLRAFGVDWQVLAATQKPVTAVIRIDGHAVLRETNFVSRIATLEQDWKTRGASLAGIEVDYDCAAARLGEYAAFLNALRRSLPRALRLSITGLPSWIDYPDFRAVASAADEIVLQVHAVRSPHEGLFDAKIAKRWISELAAVDAHPFRVALPDYSTRVVRGEKGEIVAVESEAPRLIGGSSADELVAIPADVAGLVRDLNKSHPEQMKGLVWFRLPTTADRRSWNLATLKAVMQGNVPQPRISVNLRPGLVAGAYDIVLLNDGETDVPLPARIDVVPDCAFSDAVNGFTLARDAGRITLRRLQIGMLRGHHEQVIGWTRCRGTVHVAN